MSNRQTALGAKELPCSVPTDARSAATSVHPYILLEHCVEDWQTVGAHLKITKLSETLADRHSNPVFSRMPYSLWFLLACGYLVTTCSRRLLTIDRKKAC